MIIICEDSLVSFIIVAIYDFYVLYLLYKPFKINFLMLFRFHILTVRFVTDWYGYSNVRGATVHLFSHHLVLVSSALFG